MKRTCLIFLGLLLIAPPVFAKMGVLQSIAALCEKEWPGDYRMQAYCQDQHKEAAVALKRKWESNAGLPANIFDEINKKCFGKWFDRALNVPNPRMWNHCIEQQVEAYRKIH